MSLTTGNEAKSTLSFLWLEITGKCQLCCVHCYAESGPQRTHGTMKTGDWRRVIDEAATLGARMVQFIGGEPTLHPALSDLVGYVLSRGMTVEVFSNLVHVSSYLWSVFSQPGVCLATSYYADQDRDHEAVTGRRGSYPRTTANIAEAVRRSIPLRVGLISVLDGQRVEQARQQLETLGIMNLSTDRLRQVGRGVRNQRPDSSQLCGGCARGKIAVASNGDVWPCVFARWMLMGNVQATPLREIATVSKMEETQAKLSVPRPSDAKCAPETPKCSPETQCQPANDPCQPHCPPGYHSEPKRCWPYYYQERKR